MNNIIRINLSLYLFSLLLLFQCSSNELSGIEVTNGNCIGKIYNEDSTPASGALVRLIPSGFDPTDPSSGKIDSTYTREDGTYSFSVSNSGSYTLFAEKQNKFCKQDSVFVLSKTSQSLRDDTLTEPAILSGSVRVKPGSDVTKAIILFIGTNLYISPSDSSGNFGTVSLPDGNYRVKAFTTENGYGTLDTMIKVSRGEKHSLTITIPLSYAPQIASVSVKYDSSSFYSTVNWSKADTSQIMSYSLRRFINNIEDTMILVNKSLQQYRDNCRSFFDDTISYKICAVGKNYKEGYLSDTKPFIVKANAEIKSKIVFDTVPEMKFIRALTPIANDFLCSFYNLFFLYRIHPDGTVSDIRSNEQLISIFQHGLPEFKADSLDNVYAVFNYYPIQFQSLIYKLNDDFSIQDSLVYNDTAQYTSTIGSDGSVYFESHNNYADTNDYTRIKVYDPSFNYKQEFTINSNIQIMKCLGDRILAVEYKSTSQNNKSGTEKRVVIYDTSFNILSAINITDFCRDIISDNMFVTYVTKDNITTFSLHDIQGNILTEIKLPSDINYLTTESETMFFSKGNKLFAFTINQLAVN